jgi:hypothetical protein
MLNKKTLLLFLLKAVLLYGLLAAPLSFYDKGYANFYRACGKVFFSTFRATGFVQFMEEEKHEITRVIIGNYSLRRPDNTVVAFAFEINTRYLGYMPTILLICLVLASPVPWKRKLISLVVGFTLVTALIMFKQWIELLTLCEQNSWLQLTSFSPTQKKFLDMANKGFSLAASTILYFVVAIWLLVTFRLDDLKPEKVKKTEKVPPKLSS